MNKTLVEALKEDISHATEQNSVLTKQWYETRVNMIKAVNSSIKVDDNKDVILSKLQQSYNKVKIMVISI